MAKDEYTCAWWETIKSDDDTQKRDQDPVNTSTASKPQSTAKLSIFDSSLDTPSNALTHRVHLDLPALTAPIQFNSKGTQLIVVENDSLYCVDTKSGDLAWSITTSNAGLTGDWTNICLFKDFELNDALVGITADGWAVDVTDGYVRWRLYLGLREGDSIVSAAAMDGHLSIHKWSAARNQFAIGHHIAYSTKRGGLFVIGLHQLGLGLKFALLGSKTSLDDDHGNGIRGEPPVPDLTPVINRIVGTSCDITTGLVLAVDATSVLHTSTAQQIRIATAGDAVLYGSIINSGITVVTTRNVFSFASYGNGSQLFKESALSNTPKTYTHPAKILNCVAVPVTVSSVFSTLLFLFDSTNTITTLSIPKTNGEGPPTVSSTMQIANNASDPIFILLPKVIDDTVSEITTITKQGRISNHSLDKKQQQPPQPPPPSSKSSKAAPSPAAPPPVTLSRIITENVFSESGCVLGVPGIKDPQVTCAGYSKNNQLLALGDSCGGIRILALGPTASETTGSEPSPANPGDSSRSASTSEAKTNDNGNRSENGIIAGLRIHAAHFSSALVGLKWISDVEFVSVSADGVLAVWKTDRALKKVAVCGLLDGGNSTPTCLDVIEGSVDDHDDCCEFRVCVGGTDGRVNEYSLYMQ
ncbi:hypothetical protein BDR26DRAFT_504747 [Obelidium mucronatum]|nr:hypothetical protein BDR26DRAFT_504747 [Obelidium mucronatum]